MTKRIRMPDAYASNFFAGGPGGAPSNPPLLNTRSGIWIPFANSDIPVTTAIASATVQGVVNQEQVQSFINLTPITVGHVAFNIGTGLAAAAFGVAIYSADGTTKLTAADGVSVAASGVKYVALSASLSLLADTMYWIGWTCTDATTVTIDNVLQTAPYQNMKNASGVIQYGRDTTDATAGGVTLASLTFANIVSVQLRVPLFFFSE